MRKLLGVLILVLALPCSANVGVSYHGAGCGASAAASCTCETTMNTCALSTAAYDDLYTGYRYRLGGRYTAEAGDDGQDLCGIKVTISANYDEDNSGNYLSCRVGTSADLTSGYQSGQVVVPSEATGDYTVELDTAITMSESTVYYTLCDYNDTYANRLTVERETTGSGCLTSGMTGYGDDSGGEWQYADLSGNYQLEIEFVKCN